MGLHLHFAMSGLAKLAPRRLSFSSDTKRNLTRSEEHCDAHSLLSCTLRVIAAMPSGPRGWHLANLLSLIHTFALSGQDSLSGVRV